MENHILEFSFLDTNESFKFKDGFSFIKNSRLLKVLKTENFNNDESNLVIKSLNDTKINEVFQLKINIKYIGYFLVNFPLKENAKEKYLPLIDEIKLLKDDTEEKGKQLLKIEKVILILNKYNPIYSVFIGREDTFLYLKECNKVNVTFPLLFPSIEEEVNVKVIEKPKKEVKEKKESKSKFKFDFKKLIQPILNIEGPFFTLDFLFDLVFSFFLTFALYATCAFFYKSDLKGLLFLFQIFFYCFCLVYNLYLSKIKGKRKDQEGIVFIIYAYILLGVGLGNLGSFFFVEYALKMNDVPLLALPIILSFVICASALPLLKVIYNYIKKRKLN